MQPSRRAREITDRYMEYHRRVEGFDGGYLHDPLSVASIIDESLCRWEELPVAVETLGEHTQGMTVAEMRPALRGGRRPNARVAVDADGERFQRLFLERTLG